MKKIFQNIRAVALAAVAFAFAGCETESSSSASISVSPGFARVPSGQSVVLTASGGDGYGWSLSNASYGHLSANSGSRVVYTAAKNDVTQIVTLKVTLGSSTAECQATIAQGNESYASSVSISTSSSATPSPSPSGSDPSTPSSSTLSISPSSVEMKNGTSRTFTASAGDNCTWSLANASYGVLSATTGSSVTYTASRTGVTQTITATAVVNGVSRKATATVRQVTYAAGDEIELGGD